jgi:hypothetical protein
VYHGKVTYLDAVNMPVFLRRWWINKLNETTAEEDRLRNEAQKAQQQYTSRTRRS